MLDQSRITGLMFDSVSREPLYAVLRTSRQMCSTGLRTNNDPFDALFDRMVQKEPPDLQAFQRLCHVTSGDLVISSSSPQQIVFNMPNIKIAVIHNSSNNPWKVVLTKFETPAMGALYLASLTELAGADGLQIHFTANNQPSKARLSDVIRRLNAA